MLNEEMKTIFVSEIDTLDSFDIVRLIDDETQEFIGYFLNEQYSDTVDGLERKKSIDKKALVEEFRRLRKNISTLEDETIHLCKIDEEMNGDISFYDKNDKINE